jgi:NitT/TauT family transport system substrate-binding protein
MARIGRRLFMTLAGAVSTIGAGLRAQAATPINLTLPWLPLGTFSLVFVAKSMGLRAKRGLDVTVDRGIGSGKVCVPGRYDFGIIDLAVMMNCVGRGLDLMQGSRRFPARNLLTKGVQHHETEGPGRSNRRL